MTTKHPFSPYLSQFSDLDKKTTATDGKWPAELIRSHGLPQNFSKMSWDTIFARYRVRRCTISDGTGAR